MGDSEKWSDVLFENLFNIAWSNQIYKQYILNGHT